MAGVSVILPTHNRAATLARAIRSVLDQTYPPSELIIVDDASSDQTDRVLEQFDDCRIRYLRITERVGAGAARNAGIAHSRCQFLAFQDSDDEWLPTKLAEEMALFAKSTNDVGVVYCDMMRIGKNGSQSYCQAPTVESDALIDPVSRQYYVQNIGIATCLIKRKYVEAVGGFDETLPALEDLELLIRLSRQCRFQRLPEALFNYYETDGISSDRLKLARARRMLLELCAGLLRQDKWFVAIELAAIAGMEQSVGTMRSECIVVDPTLGRLPQPKVPSRGQIALTFDDGPHPVHTPNVLSVLAHYGLKANFFLVGENAKRHPNLVKQMVEQGHVVGSHSFDHADLTTLDLEAAKENILNGQKAVSELAGRHSPFFRFPYGRSNSALESCVFDLGLLQFSWDIDSMDWSTSEAEAIVQRVIQGLKDKRKGIILLHDSREVTASALANMLELLNEMAQFVYFDWSEPRR